MELFDHYLIQILKELPFKDLLQLQKLVRRIELQKNEVFLNQGVNTKNLYYISKGIVRGYHIDDIGEEKTIFLRFEKEFVADPGFYFYNKSTTLNWETLEDTTVLQFDYFKLKQISEKNIVLLNKIMDFEKKFLTKIYERLENFIIFNHEDRFRQMISKYPDICNRVPDKHLASFLGMTPVSLSRIKKRVITS